MNRVIVVLAGTILALSLVGAIVTALMIGYDYAKAEPVIIYRLDVCVKEVRI